MEKQITLKIDGRSVTVPEGTLIVNAAKQLGIVIPVFCYHPKLKPAGMCRVCMVEVGRPRMDNTTGSPMLNEDGTPIIVYGPKLETSCTTPVSEGMVVWGATEKVIEAQKGILEFLLTSHPLDCPVCDKGGECPLQNLTMKFGPTDSRFLLDEKHHGEKRFSLGELIILDRERCILCGRCVRFQDQIADDPVLAFDLRGRDAEIITNSTPGFDSIFSGNTTDICPVGALTTSDFRFGARPWEMEASASICNQCPVGCNIMYNIRREARKDGKVVIKRVLPRQNEEVNEIWMCDKGRFTYQYYESPERLTSPLIRRGGELVKTSWEEAIEFAAQQVRAAATNLAVLASGRLSNEDLFTLKKFADTINGKAILHTTISGGDRVAKAGMTPGSNLGSLGKGSLIFVIGSDLHEEAPVWWLRVKKAAENGATLVVANPRSTRLDKFATLRIRYDYGNEVATLQKLITEDEDLKLAVKEADNLVFMYGSEGMGLTASSGVADLLAGWLDKSGHKGKPNSGLIAVWQKGNDQGAWEIGFDTSDKLTEIISAAMGVYIAGADPASEDPELKIALQRAGFVIVQDLFLTETAKLADVVLPAQAIMEREGTIVSGERRMQYYTPAVTAPEGTQADHVITRAIAEAAGIELAGIDALDLFECMTAEVETFNGVTFRSLKEVHQQLPPQSRDYMYYGGTSYENKEGIGVILPQKAGVLKNISDVEIPQRIKLDSDALLAVPVTRLYDRGATVTASGMVSSRILRNLFSLHPADAHHAQVENGESVLLKLDGREVEGVVTVNETQPQGVVLVTRSMGAMLSTPVAARISALQQPEEKT